MFDRYFRTFLWGIVGPTVDVRFLADFVVIVTMLRELRFDNGDYWQTHISDVLLVAES